MTQSEFDQWVDKSEGPDACWWWKGWKQSKSGYGRVNLGTGLYLYAHRLAFMLAGGTIPENHCVCHRCDHKLCVNPKHLFTGTIHDNNLDKLAKNRQSKGEAHPVSKLNNATVKNIRALGDAGLHTLLLAKIFNIEEGNVRGICSGRQWKHVSGWSKPLPRERKYFVNYGHIANQDRRSSALKAWQTRRNQVTVS